MRSVPQSSFQEIASYQQRHISIDSSLRFWLLTWGKIHSGRYSGYRLAQTSMAMSISSSLSRRIGYTAPLLIDLMASKIEELNKNKGDQTTGRTRELQTATEHVLLLSRLRCIKQLERVFPDLAGSRSSIFHSVLLIQRFHYRPRCTSCPQLHQEDAPFLVVDMLQEPVLGPEVAKKNRVKFSC